MDHRLPTLAALAVLLLASPAAAQELEDRSPRVAANLALGFAGELDAYIEGPFDGHSEADLDPSVGFDFRFELPVLDFLVIGALFEFLTTEPDDAAWEREETMAFDAFVRGRWVFEVIADTLFLEPYVLLPIGVTVGILPDFDNSGDDDVFVGWNTAVLLGAQLLHQSGFGGYLELGWRHAEVYDERGSGIARTKTSFVLNEMAFNLGVVYAF